jgi:MYXO-CTERM domain-containing protein
MRSLPPVLLSLLFCGQAAAFTRSTVPTGPLEDEGPCLFWRPRTIPFVLNSRGSASAGREGALDAARESFRVWTQPSCTDLRFEEQPETSSAEVGYDQSRPSENSNLVVWREVACSEFVDADDPCLDEGGCNNAYDCWEHSSETIAVTTTTFSNRTGEIFDADIEMNGAYFVFSTVDMPVCPQGVPIGQPPGCVATDLQNTLVHEIGHVVGLDHVTDSQATMYLSAQSGETEKRTLEDDDIEGLCHIYPAGEATVTCVQEEVDARSGCAGCSAAGPPPGLLGAVALLGLARRRRARTPAA